MSYDLLVATAKRPPKDVIEAFGAAAGLDLALEGQFGKGNVLVTRRGNGGRDIDIDGPSRTEPDDLPDDLAGSVRRPAWLVEIHLLGGFEASSDVWAFDLAISMARVGNGAVYDPQTDKVIWPTGVVPRARGSKVERFNIVEIEWIVPWSRLPAHAPSFLLAVLRDVWPEAVPVRFGTYEPMQGRLDRDGDEAFASVWREEVEGQGWGGSIIVTGTRPVLGGYISIPDRRALQAVTCLSIHLTVDARPLYRDPATADQFAERLVTIAERLTALYADATVRRNWILRGARLDSDGDTEYWSESLNRGGRWGGLPPSRPWVAWYGPEYAPLLAATFDGHVRTHGEALVVRFGREPADSTMLADSPRVPIELMGPGNATIPAIDDIPASVPGTWGRPVETGDASGLQ
jgi:hypothetical protein